MQPMLIIRSAVPGMVSVNGRFAGEAGEDSAVSLPVSARGTLYIELKPLQGGYLPLARRIALSNGRPVRASMEGLTSVYAVCWPGGVLELMLMPERTVSAPTRVVTGGRDGLTMLLSPGEAPLLTLSRGDETVAHELPRGALAPEAMMLPDGALVLTGALSGGGRYLLALGPDLREAQLSLSGREIRVGEDGSVRALVDMGDSVGHARLANFSRSGGQFVPGEAESLWAQGGPNWPDTPEATALAALEAALLGLRDEAHAYFTPGFRAQDNRALVEAGAADSCTRLRYPMPDGRPAVGLVHLTGEACAEVTPVLYHAQPMGGSQGTWRIDSLDIIA